MSLARWMIVLLGVVQLALTFSIAGGVFLVWQKFRAAEARAWEDYARAAAAQIRHHSRDLLAWLEGVARDPYLVDKLAAGERSLEPEEQRLTRIIPHAVQVRILSRAVDRLVETDNLGLGFADLDLVQRAKTGNPPPAVHAFTSSDRHVAVARAVKLEGRVVGVVLVGTDFTWLQQTLPTPSRGAISLHQGALQLVYRGDGALRHLPPTGIVPVTGTAWQLHYWMSVPEWTELIAAASIWAVALVCIAATFWIGWRKWARAIERDRVTLFTLVNDLTAGIMRGNYTAALRELQPLLDRLVQVQPPGGYPRRPAAAAEAEAAPPAGPEPSPASSSGETLPPQPEVASVTVPEAILHFNDIRGVAGDHLTPAVMRALGRAIGSEAGAQGEPAVIVGRDARASSEELGQALIEGLRASGQDVIDLGRVPTPLVYFATQYLPARTGVMVTAGHSPPQYNGLKLVVAGEPWCGERLRMLSQRLESGDLSAGMGMLENRDLLADYIGAIIDDVQIGRPLKVVVDCGAGVAAQVVPALLRTLGCEVEELHSQAMLDPFAAHALDRLSEKMREDGEAELGLAFDGDGDRLAVVDARGDLILPDRVLMLLAADVLSREPGGDIVFDLECGRHLAGYIVQHGGRPLTVPSGYCQIRAKMIEAGAVLGGEFSGHLVFQERWFGFDDAIYGAARLLEILSAEPLTSDEVFAELPSTAATPELGVDLDQDEVGRVMRVLVASADRFFNDAKINPLDGVRVDFADGWGLVRPSHTGPTLIFRFEADDETALARIQTRFREWFRTMEISLELPF